MTGTVITLPSPMDGEAQYIRYREAAGSERPLLMALHGWDGDYREDSFDSYAAACLKRDWHLVFPDFRGPNNRPEACASDRACADVLDAVNWAKEQLSVDHRRVFLTGQGGGGHMALIMAAQAPSIWTAISVWGAVSDLARWHSECASQGLAYAFDLEAICGGAPGTSPSVDARYAARSPIHSLWRAHITPTDINAGILDGRDGGPVPISQSIGAFNKLAHYVEDYENMVSEDVIAYLEEHGSVPSWYDHGDTFDPAYDADIVLRRISKLTRLTIYEGGEGMLTGSAFAWFDTF